MSTLYRDYRPQNFAEVLGQNHIKITLQNEIIAGRLAHAFLFCGPRAVGKTTLARVLVKTVNCETRQSDNFEPCNNCDNCRNITLGKSLDVVEIDAASNTGVDNVRDNIITFSRLAPSKSKFKVFIIDEVHMLSVSAFNALLKIIEEPPSYVVFILCTTEIHKVPNTIISRCERFDFRRISVKDVVSKLSGIASNENIQIDKDVLELVARRSGGHLRDAESLLGQIFSLGSKKITSEQVELVLPSYNSNEALNLIDFISRKDSAKAVSLINNLVDSGSSMKMLSVEIVNLLRKIMLGKINPELIDSLGLDLGESLSKRLNQLIESLSWEQILIFTKRFMDISVDNRIASIPQLPLELAVVELCNTQINLQSNVQSAAQFKSGGASVVSSPLQKIKSLSPGITVVDKEVVASESPVNNVNLAKSHDNLSIAAVRDKWPEFLVKIKKHNHSLSFIMQNCEPGEIKDGSLCLAFKYKFHQDRINDPSIKKMVEESLAETFGLALGFNSLVDEGLEIRRVSLESVENSNLGPVSVEIDTSISLNSQESENSSAISSSNDSDLKPSTGGLMADLLKTFGGEVIN